MARVRRLRKLGALIARDYSIASSYRMAFALDAFYGLLNLLVFFFISRTLPISSPDQLQGAESYFDFAAVGVAVTLVVAATATGLARSVREEQLTGTLEALVGQPITTSELAFGLAGYPFLFAVVRSAVYLLLAAPLFGLDFSEVDWVGFVLVLASTALSLVGIGIALGALVIVVKRGEALAAVVVFGMGVISGSMFPVSVLPGWAEMIAHLLPTKIALDAMRSAIFRGYGWGRGVMLLIVFAIVLLPLSIVLFAGALQAARKTATLSQY